MRKKFKFTKDFVHGNKKVDKKGSTVEVTEKHAKFLAANKFGSVVGDVPEKDNKEDKDADNRKTK